MEPLKKVLDHEEMKKIFSNVEVLETLHAELLRDLKQRWEETHTIGDSLTRIVGGFSSFLLRGGRDGTAGRRRPRAARLHGESR